MRFKTLAIFGVIIGSAIFPQVALGAVLYEQNVQDTTIIYQNSAGVNYRTTYDVLGTGTGNYFPATGGGGTIYTTVSPITTIRFKLISGVSCTDNTSSGFASGFHSVLLSPWISPYTYSNTGQGVVDGDFCDVPFSIPSGVSIGALLHQQTGAIEFSGSASIGRTYNGDNIYTNIGGFAFALCSDNDCGNALELPVDTTTRFDLTIPSATSTPTVATSTSVGAQVYINPDDYVDGMYLEMSFYNRRYHATGVPSVYELTYGDKYLKLPITASSTVLNLATTTVFSLIGDTNAIYRISRPTTWWESIVNFFTLSDTGFTTILEKNFDFTVSEKSGLDLLLDQNTQALDDLFNATTTPVTNCGITTFNMSDCLTSLIIPNARTMRADITNLRNMVLTHAPIGYVTRFTDIMLSNATSSLPVVLITFTPDSPLVGSPLTFDIGDMFVGGAELLESIKDPNTNKSTKDIFLPLVQLGVALSVVLTIISDIMKTHQQDERKKYT